MTWPPNQFFTSSWPLCHCKERWNNWSPEVEAVCKSGYYPHPPQKRDCMSLMIHIKLLAMSKCATRGALSQEISPNFPCKYNYLHRVNGESLTAVITLVRNYGCQKQACARGGQHAEWLFQKINNCCLLINRYFFILMRLPDFLLISPLVLFLKKKNKAVNYPWWGC